MRRWLLVLVLVLGASLLGACESCCNAVDVVDARVAIALDVRAAYGEGSAPLAEVLAEHGLTVTQFEDIMVEIAEDPALALAYRRAVAESEGP